MRFHCMYIYIYSTSISIPTWWTFGGDCIVYRSLEQLPLDCDYDLRGTKQWKCCMLCCVVLCFVCQYKVMAIHVCCHVCTPTFIRATYIDAAIRPSYIWLLPTYLLPIGRFGVCVYICSFMSAMPCLTCRRQVSWSWCIYTIYLSIYHC